MSSSFEATLHQLPAPLLDKLRAIIRRVRLLLLVRGLCATLAVGLLSLLAIMAVDATVMLFDSGIRWVLTLTGLGLTVATAWWFLVRPLSKKITLTHIARILEIRHPELQERISTAVELMSSDDPESVKGSEELIAAVVDSAVEDVGHVDPKTEFKAGRASRFAVAAGAAAVVLLLLLAVWPRQASVLVARAVAPFLDLGNVWSDTLEVQPGDVRVAIGENVTIEMTIRNEKLKRAEIRRTLADGTESVERMTPVGEARDGIRRFAISFSAVQESFDYRVRAGSAMSRFFAVDAVPKPMAESLGLRYDFPEYTGWDPVEETTDSGSIRTLAHTRVTITAATNKPVSEAEFTVVGVPTEVETSIEPGQVVGSFVLAPETESLWRLGLTDADGFRNEVKDRLITAIPDLAPDVAITSPSFKEMKLRPSELLPIRYSTSDDIGLSEITLLVTPAGEPISRQLEQPTPEAADGEPGTWHGMASLNLAELALKRHQRRLMVQLRVRDNLPAEFGGPNEGFSEKLIIIIDENAKTLAEQTLAAQKEEIREAIQEAEQELRQAKNKVQQAERRLAREDKVSTDAMRDLDEFREQANAAQETLREVAQRAEETAFREQGQQLKEVAEEEVAKARESADMIPVTDEKNQRVADAREAQKQVDEALRDLQEIERSLRDADEDMRMVAELNELANEQRQLAQDAAERAEEEQRRQEEMAQQEQRARQEAQQQQWDEEMRRQMAEFRQQQEQVQEELGEMLRESPEALRDILAQQQQQAAELAEQAESISQEQESMKNLTEAAAQAEAEQQEEFQDQLMAALGQRQEQIAQETEELQQQLENQQAQSGEALQSASEQTREAADSLNQQEMQSASESAQQASEALSQASEQAETLAQQEASRAEGEDPGGTDSESGEESGETSAESASLAEASQSASESGQEPTGDQSSPSQDPGSPTDSESATGESQGSEGQMAEASSPQDGGEEEGPTQNPFGESSDGEMAPTESAEPTNGSPLAAEETRAQLAELAQEQQLVAQQLAAIEAGQFDDALAMMEQELAQETQSLQQQAEALEQATEAAQQWDAKGRADQAENSLQGAADQAQQASDRLAQAQEAQNAAQEQGQPANQPAPQAQQALQQSQGNQNQAQQAMSQAAQSLEQASQMLAQSLENMQVTPEQQSDVLNPQNLSEAFDDTSQSAQSQDSQQAAQNAQQAAESLQQLAQAAMEQMGAMGQQPQQPGQPNPQGQPEFVDGANPQLNETGMKTADINGDGVPPELEALGISAADWARLKGNLRSGGTTQGGDDLPAEYRELVGRYFEVIAREAGQTN